MTVLVTGATGLLGGRLVPVLRAGGFRVVTHGSSSPGADTRADLRDRAAAHELLEEVHPDAVVHLVCYSDVDGCEQDPNRAFQLNARALEHVAEWVGEQGDVRLLQVSTDQVYDGPGHHREPDVTIRNTYAVTKYCAEVAALAAGGVVLRTNFFGRSNTDGRRSFTDWLIRSLEEGAPIKLVTDVYFNPLSMETLSRMVLRVLDAGGTGVFNVASRGGLNKRDFSHAVAKRLGLSTATAVDARLGELGLRATRPTGMLMDTSRFEAAYQITMPTLTEEIESAEL